MPSLMICLLGATLLLLSVGATSPGSRAAPQQLQSQDKSAAQKGQEEVPVIVIPPGKEDAPAEEVFKNIEILKGKPAKRLPGMMIALNGLLGVPCTHCHVKDDWAKEEPPAKLTARKMFHMIGYINDSYFDRGNKVSCWTCHHGSPQPALSAPDELRPKLQAALADNDKYFSKEDRPAGEVYKNIQMPQWKAMPAPRLKFAMAFFTVALNVYCSHCHVSGEWEKDDKPPKQTARKMFAMVNGIGKDYFEGVNKVSCWTCHRGGTKPELMAAQPAPPK
jgi:hypothetical protein